MQYVEDARVPSTYKFKIHIFRHGRRTAPTFGTHIRIETRLALTNFFLPIPPQVGLGGYILMCVGCVMFVCGFVGLWHDVCGMCVTAPKLGTYVRIDTLTLNKKCDSLHPKGV